MLRYDIKKPIWNTESVGIAKKRVVGDTAMEITISYKDKDGQKVYPYRYVMRTEKIREYPLTTFKTKGSGSIELYVVPIADFYAADKPYD